MVSLRAPTVVPQTLWPLGVLTVSVKAGCVIEVLASVSGQFAAIYGALIHLDISMEQARRNCWAGSGRFPKLRSRCGAVHVFGLGGHFLWQAQSKVNFSWQVQEIGVVLLRCADFVTGAVL